MNLRSFPLGSERASEGCAENVDVQADTLSFRWREYPSTIRSAPGHGAAFPLNLVR